MNIYKVDWHVLTLKSSYNFSTHVAACDCLGNARLCGAPTPHHGRDTSKSGSGATFWVPVLEAASSRIHRQPAWNASHCHCPGSVRGSLPAHPHGWLCGLICFRRGALATLPPMACPQRLWETLGGWGNQARSQHFHSRCRNKCHQIHGIQKSTRRRGRSTCLRNLASLDK